MAIALDEAGLRDQVFELRRQNPPVSWPKIGEQLGISRSKAQRLFNRRAQPSSSSSSTSIPAASGPSTPSYEQLLDPDVRERRRQLELRRIADAEQDLELRGLERQKRIALLQNAGGGDGATTMLLMQMVDRLERRIDVGSGGQATQHAPTLFEQLNDVAKLQDVIAKFQPATPPNAALDLEWRTRMAALDREDKRIAEQHERELAVRQAQVDSENRRNDMLARFIEGFGPTLSKVAEKYVDDHMRPSQPQNTALAIVPAGAAAMQQRQEIQGECPLCRTPIGKSTPEPEKCPGCGNWLVLDTMGQIALADDSGAAPAPMVAQANGAPAGYVEPQRFAS